MNIKIDTRCYGNRAEKWKKRKISGDFDTFGQSFIFSF